MKRSGNEDLENENEGIEELLRQAGAREEPAEAMAREVYEATHAEWRAVVERTALKRRRLRWAMAAGVAAVAVAGGFLMLRVSAPALAPVASVARVEGRLRVGGVTREVGQTLMAGETAVTDAGTRAALTVGKGLSVRLDQDTQVQLLDKNRLKLETGALYVDAKPGVRDELTVETAAGSVRHVGTQYAVRTTAGGIEVGVREGRVLIVGRNGTHTGGAGEKILLTSTGKVTRTVLAPQHSDWQWAMSIAPPFDIDGQSLASFLEWVSRESGRKLVYASDEARIAAEQAQLHGSIAGLEPNTAVATVLSTTQLRQSAPQDVPPGGILKIVLDKSGSTLD